MNKLTSRIVIAFIIWSLKELGGSEKVVYELARNLDKVKYKVIIISFNEGLMRERYENIGIEVFSIQENRRKKIKLFLDIRRILIQNRVKIINPHHFGPFYHSFFAKLGLNIKMVYTEHSRWQLEELNLLERIINKILLSKADAIIAISKQIENYYIEKLRVPPGKIHLIHNGVEIKYFVKRNGDLLRKNLGIGQKELLVGIVANLRPEKNHKLLVSAFSRLYKEIDNIRLLIVGNDYMNGEVQKYVEKIGLRNNISFLGKRDDIPDILSILDVFCLPSIHEGLPLTLLEAMAVGVPVVGADVMGINEVIIHEENGFLFPSNDEGKLKETLKIILKNKSIRDRLSLAGRDFVEHNYSLNDKVNQYERLFSSVVLIKGLV